jgi:hypothetical protein
MVNTSIDDLAAKKSNKKPEPNPRIVVLKSSASAPVKKLYERPKSDLVPSKALNLNALCADRSVVKNNKHAKTK